MSSETPTPSGAFSGSDDPGVSYKPISPMAVTSFLLGVASLGAFFAGVLWILPPIAVFIAGATSRRLEAARTEYAGQFIAKIGLLMAVIALVGAPTIYFTKRFILARESRVVADAYLDLVLEGKLRQAFCMTAPLTVQAGSNDNVDVILDRMGREFYQGFLGHQVVGMLGMKGADVQVTHSGIWYEGADKGVEKILHQYIVTLYDETNEPTGVFSVPLILSGSISPEWTGRRWMIESQYFDAYDPSKSKTGR